MRLSHGVFERKFGQEIKFVVRGCCITGMTRFSMIHSLTRVIDMLSENTWDLPLRSFSLSVVATVECLLEGNQTLRNEVASGQAFKNKEPLRKDVFL